MPRFFVFLVIFAGMALAGCNFVGDFSDAQESQQQVTEELSTALGGDVQVGWNIHNGTLQRVSVHLPEEIASDRTFEDLKGVIAPVVTRHFEERPSQLQIAVVVPKQRL
ncbi:hypothetical protein AN478_00190 [Thiohalorhabdus denitrificans]|uniref:Uncharacterized protein n=1 Tax=Thiohalorhabdus denitrificans TaxID=381306 RepID=A0A0P9EH27_9GAMM|nr:hypothetical protein [Thiohalorhabdus denitrificans]KPV41860.1 hypothetical protein AN478_00190 [Thiohalorhabdus denitrificans]SCY64779.1 hypothetical protein SAMN05661077_0008 [Thiohalorhabdus denitrificans]